MMLNVPLRFTALEAVPRRGEPVTVGLPWPRGAITDETHFALTTPDGPRFLQTQVLERWPDGSVRWCLFDFLADWDGQSVESGFQITVDPARAAQQAPVHLAGHSIEIDLVLWAPGLSKQFSMDIEKIETPATPLRSVTERRRTVSELVINVRTEYYPPSGSVRIHVQIVNPDAAEHPSGNWNLGTAGSRDLTNLAVIIRHHFSGATHRIARERGSPFTDAMNTKLLQASSGGEHWKSNNHLTRNHKFVLPFRGYQQSAINSDNISMIYEGDRATPIAVVENDEHRVALTMTDFWQQFPKSIELDSENIWLGLLPEEAGPHEIQGGEQKTFTFTVSFAKDTITAEPLVWARSPITVTAPPAWYAACEALPYLTPKDADPHADYLALVQQALDGPDTFERKREAIDEYGWRHFGDLWGDHEAVDHPGPEPMVSHYNNQYDCIAAFLIHYLRSGDERWLKHGLQCADHTGDIDIYHTKLDKAAYNGGLFWHTYHYAAADTGTHRSYPKSLRKAAHFDGGQDLQAMGNTGAALAKNYAVGGGPSAAHNYNLGFLLAYYLTGNPEYRRHAIGLADFVLNIDDGSKTVFRWLSRRDTGLAIQSSAGYLGPGRASANSLNALLVGHRASGDAKYLAKAEQIIRRVVHPKQNLEALDLLNAELRWFYTMFLQALGAYLDRKIELDQLDEHYAYARLSLLHFARFMAERERPILSQPEKLQYPTETWAAQDLRKVEVFQYAAKHAEGAERELFLERAEWFFNYCTTTLTNFPPTARGIATKSLCRPVILCMKYGWTRAWWKANPTATAPPPRQTPPDFGTWTMDKPQKEVAVRRAKRLVMAGVALGVVALVSLVVHFVS